MKTNHHPGPWTEVSNENGIRVVEVGDFSAFFEFVYRGFGDTDSRYLWRGQKNALWDIKSSLARSGKPDWGLLHNFRNAVARCTHLEYKISGNGEDAEEAKLRLWSLGQHNGLFTPLIDWTIYPYVALFFAFAEPDELIEERAVFALDWGEIQNINFDITDQLEKFKKQLLTPPYTNDFKEELKKKYGVNFGEENFAMIDNSNIPLSAQQKLLKWESCNLKSETLRLFNSTTNENPRIHSQGGRHIYTPNDASLESWITKIFSEDKKCSSILNKIVLKNSERKSVLRSLNKMNINYLSLFPDFAGAALHCNMALLEQHRTGLRDY